MTDTNLKPTMDAMKVAAYLRRNPSFLKNFPDLTMRLQVPREQGPAASLAGYQLENLRAANAELSRRLAELVEIARDNEQLMMQVHSLNMALMRAATLEQTVRTVVAGLTEDFQTDMVCLVLFTQHDALPQALWLRQSAQGAAAWPAFAEFLDRREPMCGRLAEDKLKALFGDRAGDVRSAALMRLGDVGMLAIASGSASRFHPGIGTVFLTLIAEAVAAALARYQDDV